MGRFADAVSEIKKAPLVTGGPATPDAKGYCALNQTITGADRLTASAIACAASGDRELALRSLEAGYENGDLVAKFVRSPEFDLLRSEPRYIAVMRKMGLQP